MRLSISALFSPDLVPLDGIPADLEDFSVFVEPSLADERRDVAMDGAFITHTLVLHRFSWDGVRARIEKLLRHTESCATWLDAIAVLGPFLKYAD